MKNRITLFTKALFEAFRMVFYLTIFRLPLSIWTESIRFLCRTYENSSVEKQYLKSEMKVISWLNLFLSGLIFFTYPIGILLIASLFFKGFTWENLRGKMFFLSVVFYFLPILLSFIKEIISLMLLKYFRLECIDENIKNIKCN